VKKVLQEKMVKMVSLIFQYMNKMLAGEYILTNNKNKSNWVLIKVRMAGFLYMLMEKIRMRAVFQQKV
jgi:hypothetical protein